MWRPEYVGEAVAMKILYVLAFMLAVSATVRAQADNPVVKSYEDAGCGLCAEEAKEGHFDWAAEDLQRQTAAEAARDEQAAQEPSEADRILYPEGKEKAACDDRVSQARNDGLNEATIYQMQLQRLKERIREEYPNFDVATP